jgi:hypothetical protein
MEVNRVAKAAQKAGAEYRKKGGRRIRRLQRMAYLFLIFKSKNLWIRHFWIQHSGFWMSWCKGKY